jgi:hypothetical protein
MDMNSFITLAPGCLVIGPMACGIGDKDCKLWLSGKVRVNKMNIKQNILGWLPSLGKHKTLIFKGLQS